MDARVMFLFGAGAECFAGLPSGGEYTKQTMLTKNSKLYKALREFYDNPSTKAIPYEEVYMFSKRSHTLFEIITRALESYDVKNGSVASGNKNLDRLLSKYREYKNASEEDQSRKKDEILNDIYPAICREKSEHRTLNDYGDLVDHFLYYGAIEKDFSALISPEKAGKRIFWRLINYFWTAFFAIYGPLSKRAFTSTGDYLEVLSNLSEIKETWESEKTKKLSCGSYYEKLKEEFPQSVAATTNYTPFVEQYWGEKSVYLAGKLTQMEDPANLELYDLKETPDLCDKLVFPFMMTQAPLKPIVFPEQIREYGKFDKALNESDLLIILGYSLSENDNHVNVYLKDFLKKQAKPIVYCDYLGGDGLGSPKTEKWLLEKLRISSDDPANELVHIASFKGKNELYQNLKTLVLEFDGRLG